MSRSRQVLLIQDGGAGVHDGWDGKLVDSLTNALGDGYEVRYPRMPQEDDPNYAAWSVAIRRELAAREDKAVVASHSVGGAILIGTLTARSMERGLRSIVLTAAPFVGAGGWLGVGFEFSSDLGARLPTDVPVHPFHGLADQTVPPSHVDLYGPATPLPRADGPPRP